MRGAPTVRVQGACIILYLKENAFRPVEGLAGWEQVLWQQMIKTATAAQTSAPETPQKLSPGAKNEEQQPSAAGAVPHLYPIIPGKAQWLRMQRFQTAAVSHSHLRRWGDGLTADRFVCPGCCPSISILNKQIPSVLSLVKVRRPCFWT
jgi:hypothetical protein